MKRPKCVGALLVRDEAAPDRYLRRTLTNLKLFCDEIVVLDDNSTDDTVAVCEAEGCFVERITNGEGWWGAGSEYSARRRLWELACEHAGPEGWVLTADADHELLGITPEEFRVLLTGEAVDSWAFVLWDCWDSDELQRVDGMWTAWANPRIWLAKSLPGEWIERGIHTGHLPHRRWNPGLAPAGTGVRHLGYVKKEHRLAKAQKYLIL